MSTAEASARIWRPHPILGLLSCVLAAGLAYLVVERIYPVFAFEDLPEMGPYPSAELTAQYAAAEYAFQSSNGAVNCAILGALVGLFVGLFTSTNRVAGGIVGALAGVVAGAAGGYIAGYLSAAAVLKAAAQSLLQSVGYLSIPWGLIGAFVCGAIAALHNKSQILSALVIGIVVAVLGALAYNMITSILYPMSNLVLTTPKASNERLIWALSFGVALGLGVGLGFRSAKPPVAKDIVDVA